MPSFHNKQDNINASIVMFPEKGWMTRKTMMLNINYKYVQGTQ